MTAHFPFLQNHLVKLRDIKETDLPAVFAGLSHPEVIKYYGVSYDSLAATQAQMDWYTQLEANNTGKWFALTNAAGLFVGACGINNYQYQHQKAELGYWLLPEYWGQGFMRAALTLLLPAVFTHFSLHRLEAQVETPNQASRKLLEYFNFRYEGTLVDCERKGSGFISLDLFALLQPNSKGA